MAHIAKSAMVIALGLSFSSFASVQQAEFIKQKIVVMSACVDILNAVLSEQAQILAEIRSMLGCAACSASPTTLYRLISDCVVLYKRMLQCIQQCSCDREACDRLVAACNDFIVHVESATQNAQGAWSSVDQQMNALQALVNQLNDMCVQETSAFMECHGCSVEGE